MKRLFRLSPPSALLLLPLLLLPSTGCDRGEPGAVPPPGEPVEVVVSRPASEAVFTAHPATVAPLEEVRLATRASGTIEKIQVDVGSPVERGDLLVRLDESEIEAQVAAAEAGLRQAKRRHERIEALAADGAATEQELDDARAALEMARAQVETARAQRSYVALRAPFAGHVTARMADPGDLAVPGRPLLVLARTDSLKVLTDLPEAAGADLRPGDRLVVAADDQRLPAEVTRVSPAVDRQSRRVRVEAVMTGGTALPPSLLAGSFVRVEVRRAGRSSLWIPADAVVRRGQLEGVFQVEDDHLRLRWIRLGERRGDAVEVLAGVGADDRLVRDPAAGLVDGLGVRAATGREWSPSDQGGSR